MSALVTALNFGDGDAFYQALIELHRDLTEMQSQQVNARLILLLANHIGDEQVLREAMAAAGEDVAGVTTAVPRTESA